MRRQVEQILLEEKSSRASQTFKRKIRAISTSDQHNGHNNTPTSAVLAALSKAYSPEELDKADLAVFSGDFFDHDLSMSQVESSLIYYWILNFLWECSRRNVKVRILEGTPSHDYRQPKWFVDIAGSHGIPVDLRYMDVLQIEYIEDFGINVLYIPDEWRPRCEDTRLEVVELLAKHALDSVDLTVMHGCFPHQFPRFLHSRIDSHNPDFYSSITRQFVIIGHVHTFSQWKNIVTPGSIERLRHGEEEQKGHLVLDLDLDKPKKSTATFMENGAAQRYVTFKLNDESVNVHSLRINQLISELPVGSFIRIEGPSEHPMAIHLRELRELHSMFVWSFKKSDERKVEVIDIASSRDALIARTSTITPANLVEMVSGKVGGDELVIAILKECMNV